MGQVSGSVGLGRLVGGLGRWVGRLGWVISIRKRQSCVCAVSGRDGGRGSCADSGGLPGIGWYGKGRGGEEELGKVSVGYVYTQMMGLGKGGGVGPRGRGKGMEEGWGIGIGIGKWGIFFSGFVIFPHFCLTPPFLPPSRSYSPFFISFPLQPPSPVQSP